ncbi:MAG: hypothetical protein KFH98_07785, partial [Gemmatimonadetes bacterium]|nr:hypothetical protein [Gemmatimonadota bacterium]
GESVPMPGQDSVTVVVVPRAQTAVDDDARGGLIRGREDRVRTRLASLPVDARPLRGPLSITARNVVLNEDGGAQFARAELITAQLNTAAATRGDVILDNVRVTRPVVAMREGAGSWNYEQVFEELLSGGDGGAPRGRRKTIQLRDVRIDNGTVDVTRPVQRFALRDVQARLPLVVFSQPGLPAPYLRASAMSARFVQAEPEADLAVELVNGLFRFPTGTVHFEVEGATLDRTQLADLDGVWNPADPGYGITATGLALDVNLEDVAFALPEALPRTGTASFAFAVSPAAPDLTQVRFTDLDARTGDSRFLGMIEMRVGEEYFELIAADLRVDPLELRLVEGFIGELPYDGTLTGTIQGSGGAIAFDLSARLRAPTVPQFTTGITGSVRYTASGLVLERAELDFNRVPLAALRAIAPGLPLSGSVTGTVALSGPPTAAPLDLNVRLELGSGVALVEGMLDLTGAVPRYDLSGRLIGVDLQAILQPAVPPVSLTATFTLAGSGFDPAALNAVIGLGGRFSGWEAGPDDGITLAATIRDGTLGIDTLYGSLATADMRASGAWRFIEPQSGALTYVADVS